MREGRRWNGWEWRFICVFKTKLPGRWASVFTCTFGFADWLFFLHCKTSVTGRPLRSPVGGALAGHGVLVLGQASKMRSKGI